MLFSTIGQIHVFLWMVGAGMFIGALYFLCAGLRRLLCAGFWLTLIIDMLFGLCTALILIAAMLVANYGRVRLYELLGAVSGVCLFSQGIEPLLKRLLKAFTDPIRRFFRTIANFRLIKVIFK